ncbi:MAG: hypothetical protein HZB31_06650 [Nitrospirae bacterium]|nr:hypothetical protein [Nitrospirota bacterium]
MVSVRIFVLLFFCSTATCYALQQTTFAILPMEAAGNVSVSERTEAESTLFDVLIKSGKYRLIERAKIEQILSEQSLQLSGLIERKKASVGKLLGADKLISASIFREDSLKIRISVIDVATSRVEITKVKYLGSAGPRAIAKWAAAEILMRYPLLGVVTAVSGDSVLIDLGQEQGVRAGSRIFVAEKTAVPDDKGSELLGDYRRVGLLEAVKTAGGGSQAAVKSLQDRARPVRTGDLVALDPVPITPPVMSRTPLLGAVKEGRSVLSDDMTQKQYLSASSGKGESYSSGVFHLNASDRKIYHAYAFYPIPFDHLTDFIFEGEIEFQSEAKRSSGIDICSRSNGLYADLNAYRLYLGSDGNFEVRFSRNGARFGIIPLQSTPLIRRGLEKNTFRIVALGSKFDIYVNGFFLVSFEDEMFDAGAIGFMVDAGGYVTVNKVTVREVSDDAAAVAPSHIDTKGMQHDN